jgi:uncharacterized membrane protein
MQDQQNNQIDNSNQQEQNIEPIKEATKEETQQQPVAEASGVIQQEGNTGTAKSGLMEMLKKAENQPKVTNEEKLWGFISYIPLLGAIIALVMQPNSEYIKLHGRQGLLIFIFFFFDVFIYLFPFIGAILGILVHLCLLAIMAFSMYQALIGNWWKIPVLGEISEMIPSDLFVKVTRNAMMGPAVDKIDETAVSQAESASVTQTTTETPVQTIETKSEAINEAASSADMSISQEYGNANAGEQNNTKQE